MTYAYWSRAAKWIAPKILAGLAAHCYLIIYVEARASILRKSIWDSAVIYMLPLYAGTIAFLVYDFYNRQKTLELTDERIRLLDREGKPTLDQPLTNIVSIKRGLSVWRVDQSRFTILFEDKQKIALDPFIENYPSLLTNLQIKTGKTLTNWNGTPVQTT